MIYRALCRLQSEKASVSVPYLIIVLRSLRRVGRGEKLAYVSMHVRYGSNRPPAVRPYCQRASHVETRRHGVALPTGFLFAVVFESCLITNGAIVHPILPFRGFYHTQSLFHFPGFYVDIMKGEIRHDDRNQHLWKFLDHKMAHFQAPHYGRNWYVLQRNSMGRGQTPRVKLVPVV